MVISLINYCGKMTNEAPKLLKYWVNSISERNPSKQTSFYAKDAILLATYEPILIGQKAIYNYFVELLSKKDIKCSIRDNYSIINMGMVIASGLYTFSFKDDNNELVIIPARYTFVINKDRIIDHHSSVEPSK